jgi:hypothetical protein
MRLVRALCPASPKSSRGQIRPETSARRGGAFSPRPQVICQSAVVDKRRHHLGREPQHAIAGRVQQRVRDPDGPLCFELGNDPVWRGEERVGPSLLGCPRTRRWLLKISVSPASSRCQCPCHSRLSSRTRPSAAYLTSDEFRGRRFSGRRWVGLPVPGLAHEGSGARSRPGRARRQTVSRNMSRTPQFTDGA